MSEHVTLLYERPPARRDTFVQQLLYESADVLITYLAETPLKQPMLIDGTVALENGSPAIWFTFPGRRHDIGRFHTADGVFTGCYANIMEPIELVSRLEWRAVDLFVDVWAGSDGTARLLDEDELATAVAKGWIDADTAARAMEEAESLLRLHAAGSWPPPIVNEWTLSRVEKIL